MTNIVRFKGSWDELSELIGNEIGLTILILTSRDCIVCRRLRQVLPSIMKDNPDITFYEVEFCPENKNIFDKLGLTNVPHIFYYKGKNQNGTLNELEHLIGFSSSQIRMKINQYV